MFNNFQTSPLNGLKILIGAAGSGTAFGIIDQLRSVHGGNVWIGGTDIYEEYLVSSSVILDKFFLVPKTTDEFFKVILGQIIIENDIDVYIPILNEEIVVSSHFLRDSRFGNLQVWSSETYAKCVDKKFSYSLLLENGVPLPSLFPNSNVRNPQRKWFVKPSVGYGSHGAHAIIEQDLYLSDSFPKDSLLIQEYCELPEVTVDSFFDSDSGFIRAYCRERIEVKSGVCTKARLFQNDEIEKIAEVVGRAIKQKGAITFQLMQLNKKWVLTDLNMRTGAGTSMTCKSGFDVINATLACRSGYDYEFYLPKLNSTNSIYITRQYVDIITHRK